MRLPSGKYEVPLIIGDRTWTPTPTASHRGAPLKSILLQPEPMKIKLPFSGPFTLVKRGHWPHLEVDARWYRFRMINS